MYIAHKSKGFSLWAKVPRHTIQTKSLNDMVSPIFYLYFGWKRTDLLSAKKKKEKKFSTVKHTRGDQATTISLKDAFCLFERQTNRGESESEIEVKAQTIEIQWDVSLSGCNGWKCIMQTIPLDSDLKW